MAKYIVLRDTWISHESRIVRAGEEIDTEFPKGMRIGDNLQPVTNRTESGGKERKPPADDLG